MMDDAITKAADLFFPEGGNARGRTLNLKMGLPGRGRHVSAEELARELIHAEEEVRSGRARPVHDVDGDDGIKPR